MKNALLFFFILCAEIASADLWTQKSAIPGMEVSFSFSFTIGNKGYFGTGWKSVAPANEFWEYNPALDAWTQKADFAGAARWVATGFSIGDKGYAGMGCDQNYISFSDFWQYDTTANSWTQKASLPGSSRAMPVGFSIGNYGYYFGGVYFTTTILDDIWQYDPVSDSWTQKTSLTGFPIVDAPCFVIGTSAYVVCGVGITLYLSTLWEYNTISDSWTQRADLPSIPRCDVAAFSLCGLGYAITGETDGSTFTKETWQYDPTSNLWTQKTDFPGAARDESTYFSIGDKGYIGYGANQGWATGIFFTDFWEYTPDNPCGSFPTAVFSSVNNICPGTCINFTNLSLNATSFQWSFQGANPNASTDADPSNICYNTPGSYDVSLIATNASGSDTLTLANYITVFPFPPPQGISQDGDTLFANAGAGSYQWYFNGNIISGATDYYYLATQDGNYNVICTDNNGCETEAAIFDVFVAVGELAQNAFEIYPVPVEHILTIKTGRLNFDQIILCNALGEEIMHVTATNEIDLSNQAPGIYFIRIQSEGQIQSFKVVRQ